MAVFRSVIYNVIVIAVEAYFEPNPQFNLCYCKDCLKGRKDKEKYERGIPPKEYTLPTGWARFSLKYVTIVSVIHTMHMAIHLLVEVSQ